MANVTIIPTQPQVQTVSASGQQTQSGQAPHLPAGSTISGTIAGKDANGNFLLRTASQGTLTLRSSTPLTYNSDVTVHIDTANANATTARIISVNGEPFSSFAAPDTPNSDSVSQTLLTQCTDYSRRSDNGTDSGRSTYCQHSDTYTPYRDTRIGGQCTHAAAATGLKHNA
jgi:hypothetical protein